jgi:hypothetical protein
MNDDASMFEPRQRNGKIFRFGSKGQQTSSVAFQSCKILNLTTADQNALSCTSAIVFLFGDDGWRHRRLLFLLIRQPAI